MKKEKLVLIVRELKRRRKTKKPDETAEERIDKKNCRVNAAFRIFL